MRHIFVTAFALTIVACGPGMHAVTGFTPEPQGDAYTCVARELVQRGYTVRDGDRAAGFIQAEKRHGGAFSTALTGTVYFTEMAVAFVGDEAATEIRVTVSRVKQEGGGQRTGAGMMLAGDDQRDADEVVAACTQPGGGND